MFSGQGIPKQVFSDNGSQFSCGEFMQFAKEYKFSHVISSPKYPRSNGLIESCVESVKMLLKKSKDDGSDFCLRLLACKSSPLECGLLSAELLIGKNIRSNLPISDQQLNLNRFEKYKENFSEKKNEPKTIF